MGRRSRRERGGRDMCVRVFVRCRKENGMTRRRSKRTINLLPRPPKIKSRTPSLPINSDLEPDPRPIVHVVQRLENRLALLRHHISQQIPHRQLRRPLDLAHIHQHGIQPVVPDQPPNQRRPSLIRRDLRPQIRHVVPQTACGGAPGILGGREQVRDEFGFVEHAAVRHDLEGGEDGAFLPQLARVRRHRPRRDPAHVGVVAPRRRPE